MQPSLMAGRDAAEGEEANSGGGNAALQDSGATMQDRETQVEGSGGKKDMGAESATLQSLATQCEDELRKLVTMCASKSDSTCNQSSAALLRSLITKVKSQQQAVLNRGHTTFAVYGLVKTGGASKRKRSLAEQITGKAKFQSRKRAKTLPMQKG